MKLNFKKTLLISLTLVIIISLSIFTYSSYKSYSKLPLCIENNSSSDSKITVDFGTCTPCKGSEGFNLGSFHYRIEGKSENVCKFRYAMEVENPNWNGRLNNYCEVPISMGLSTFKENKSETSKSGLIVSLGIGYNMEKISQYCQRH